MHSIAGYAENSHISEAAWPRLHEISAVEEAGALKLSNVKKEEVDNSNNAKC
jgi:hypothetical protein